MATCEFSGHFPLIKLDDIGPFHPLGTIGTLSDDVLLEVFSCYVEEAYDAAYRPDEFYVEEVYDSACSPDRFHEIKKLEAWCTLIHVCRRWRHLVFSSPRRLNLRLICTRRNPVREMLGNWPTLPIVIDDQELGGAYQTLTRQVVNVVAALEHRDRVCQIGLGDISRSVFPILAEKMQESFPALTHLQLDSDYGSPMLHPGSFLGGSAPCLRSLTLQGISFPALPTLLSTTKNLVKLRLGRIPHSGYLSPDAMVVCLSFLTKLENLVLRFSSPQPRPNSSIRHLPLLTRVTLPSLTQFNFYGANEYIEDLVARVNIPQLHDLEITLFGEALFEASQLSQFLGQAEKFKVPRRALLDFGSYSDVARLSLSGDPVDGTTLVLPITYIADIDFQLRFLHTLSRSPPPPLQLSSFERLDIVMGHTEHGMDYIPWLELFQPFTAVKDLYLDNRAVLHLAPTLQELTEERATHVTPALQRIFVQSYGQPEDAAAQAAIGSFIAARQFSGHPVAVHDWEWGSGEDSRWTLYCVFHTIHTRCSALTRHRCRSSI